MSPTEIDTTMTPTATAADQITHDQARLPHVPALVPLREAAWANFMALGFPAQRDEDWRFTNPAPITESAFRTADESHGQMVTSAEPPTRRLRLEGSAARLVFVNGRLDRAESDLGRLDGGVRVTSLAAAAIDEPELIAEHLARHAGTEDDAFCALNTAFLDDGAIVVIPKGAVVKGAIEILWISRPNGEPVASHPRTLVVAGATSQVTVVETWVGPDTTYFTNAVTEVVAGPGATVHHYKVVREGAGGLHVGATQLDLDRDATVRSHTWTFGGKLVRNNLTTNLAAPGGHCALDGLYVEDGTQLVDNHLRVIHAGPNCDSREYFKGILDGKSRAVFTGRIIVVQDAQKTDAKQTNMNLLLSQHAQVDTKPQLEIFADDVKCTHGATIGQLDDEAIFYLRSRGISEEAARGVLTFAFAAELLERVRYEPLRDQLRRTLLERLPHGELLAEGA